MTRHHHTPTLAMLGAALTLTACSGEPVDPAPSGQSSPTAQVPSTPPPTSGSRSPKGPQDLAEEALKTYLAVATRAEKSGKIRHLAALGRVASGDAYFNERKRVLDYARNGVRLRGTVTRTLGDVVTEDPGTLLIAVCEDRARSKVLVLTSGEEVPFLDQNGRPVPDRVIVAYTVVERSKQDWVVETVDVRSDQSC